MRRGARLALLVAAAGAAALVPATTAHAVNDIVISVSGVATGAPGDVILIDEVTVPPELVGATCTGRAEAENQSSVHPNTDLIVTSGSAQVVIPDVEASPGKVTTISGTVVLGNTVRVDLRLGPDGISSGGLTIILDCVAVPPTTTTVPTTAPTTAPAPTTAVASGAVTPAPTAAATASTLPKTGPSSATTVVLATATTLLAVGVILLARSRRPA